LKIQYLATAAAVLAVSLATAPVHAGDDQKEIEKKMIDDAKKTADKAAERAAVPQYEVKKSHDEHIPATEKAAADAARKDKPSK